MRIIGIAGPPRAGKDTLCQALIRAFAARDVRAVRLALADPIWDAVSAVAGAPVDRHANTKDEPRADLANRTPREWALAIGRGARSELGGDVWLRLWQARAEASGADVVIAPDVRTLRELRHFRENGYLIGVTRPGCPRDEVLPPRWYEMPHGMAPPGVEPETLAAWIVPRAVATWGLGEPALSPCPRCMGRTRYEGDGFTCRHCGA